MSDVRENDHQLRYQGSHLQHGLSVESKRISAVLGGGSFRQEIEGELVADDAANSFVKKQWVLARSIRCVTSL